MRRIDAHHHLWRLTEQESHLGSQCPCFVSIPEGVLQGIRHGHRSRPPQPEQPRSCFEVALEAFTPSRLTAGSDWPVLLAGYTCKGWWAPLGQWTGSLAAEAQASSFAETAERVCGVSAIPRSFKPEAGVQA